MNKCPLKILTKIMFALTFIATKKTRAYAESKRALVELTKHWAERLQGSGIAVHATHPGWSDTPAAWGAVPSLAAPIRPLLRTPEQGADTLLWLAVNPSLTEQESGQFWFD